MVGYHWRSGDQDSVSPQQPSYTRAGILFFLTILFLDSLQSDFERRPIERCHIKIVSLFNNVWNIGADILNDLSHKTIIAHK